MGNCIAKPPIDGSSTKNLRRINSSFQADYNIDPVSKAVTLRVSSVLSDCNTGNIFDKYNFGDELGRGEFGITHQCIDIETGEVLACKVISKIKLKTEIDLEDVRREVEIMQHLPPHPNIVSFVEAYEDKDAVYLVMELCQGGELFDRIVARGHYTERAAADVTKTIIDVVKVNLITSTPSLQSFWFLKYKPASTYS